MIRTIGALALSLGVSLGALTTVAAGSASAASATIVSPGQGQDVAPGLTSITVDVAEEGAFSWSLEDDDYDYYEYDSVYLGAGRQRIAVPTVNHADTYTFTLEDTEGFSSDSVRFRVVAPARLTSAAVSPSTFFPVRRDGYRDHARFAFRTNTRLEAVTYEVRSSAYKTVTRHRLGARSAGVVSWAWDGRNAAGTTLPTGTYTIKATVRTAAGRTLSIVSPRIVSRTSTTKKRVHLARYGDDTSSLVSTESCYVSQYEYDGTTDLDCWGFGDDSEYARARYDFRLPTDATAVTWRVGGSSGCCERGVIRRTGERTGPRSFRIEVYVSNSRSFEVTSASVTYTTTLRR